MAALLLGGGEARAQIEVERWSADLTPARYANFADEPSGDSVYGYSVAVTYPGFPPYAAVGTLNPSTFTYAGVNYTVQRLYTSTSTDTAVIQTSPGLPDDAGLVLRLPTFRTSAVGGCSVGGDEDFDLKPSSASSSIVGQFVWRLPSSECLTGETWAAAAGRTGTVKLVEIVQPAVESVIVANAPQSGDTYRLYETILFTVTFSQPVRVTPGRLRLEVGLDNPGGASGSTVEAVFSGQSKSERPTADTPRVSVSRHLHFEYKVQLFEPRRGRCADRRQRVAARLRGTDSKSGRRRRRGVGPCRVRSAVRPQG